MPDPDGAGNDFPHSVYFVSGTQAPNARDNYLNVIKVKNIQKFKAQDAKDTESSKSSDSESETDDTSVALALLIW